MNYSHPLSADRFGHRLRFFCLVFAASAFVSLVAKPVNAATIESFDDVEFIVGNGANTSLLAIDFDGTSSADQSLVWAYRWDSAVTLETLFRDVVAADERLFSRITNFSFGNGVNGIGFDNGDGLFELDNGIIFDQDGIFESAESSDGAVVTTAGDQYVEGFLADGFFNIAEGDIDSFADQDFVSLDVGFGEFIIEDQDVYSFAFTGPTFAEAFAENPIAASLPSSIPEPSTWLGGLALVGFCLRRKKR